MDSREMRGREKRGALALFLAAFALLAPPAAPRASAQLAAVEEGSAGNFFGAGGRSMAMGGTGIATAEDVSALYYNPAGLARAWRGELGVTFSHERVQNDVSYFGARSWDVLGKTRLSGLGGVFPVPVYRGALVFGVGVQRLSSFDSIFRFQGHDAAAGADKEGLEKEQGGLYAVSGGVAVATSPKVSVGASLTGWFGKDDYEWRFTQVDAGSTTTYHDDIRDSYGGVSAKFGLQSRPSDFLSLGMVVETPGWYWVQEEFLLRSATTDPLGEVTSDVDRGFIDYQVRFSYSFGGGLALSLPYVTLSGDATYTDWSQTHYEEPLDLKEQNEVFRQSFRETVRWHAGAEVQVPATPLRLRAGYYKNPLPDRQKQVIDDRDYYTAGFGLDLDESITVDAAAARGLWKTGENDLPLTEDKTADRAFVTFRVRF